MKFNWQDESSHVLLNPRLKIDFDESELKSRCSSHVWLATSGTTNSKELKLKLVGLSKNSILTSAAAVNRHLGATSTDIWLQILPRFHIGAISIYARAFLSGASVVDYDFPLGKWDVQKFSHILSEAKATLTSLVPAQIFDLVKNRNCPPKNLRAVFVGGSQLESWLYREAKNLGWPLLPTYGMTECGSQVATASIDSPQLKILDHVSVRISDQGKIVLKSPSLLTEYGLVGPVGEIAFLDPKISGEFETEDLGKLSETSLQPLGRGSDFVKVGGEGVYLSKLRGVLHDLQFQFGINGDIDLVVKSDERLGARLEFIATSEVGNVDRLVESYNKSVMPFERAHKITNVSQIQRNELGKQITP